MKQLNFDLTFRHKKTGNLYDASSQLVIDCTNERPDVKQICIVYTDGDKIFVREAVEFLQKFELVRKIGSGGSVVSDMIHEPVELGFKVKKEEPTIVTIDPVVKLPEKEAGYCRCEIYESNIDILSYPTTYLNRKDSCNYSARRCNYCKKVIMSTAKKIS